MRRSLFAVAFALLVGVFGAGAASAQSRGDLKCESWNYQPARCPVEGLVDARISSVIAGQCYQGRSWGYDRGGIWVSNGCRAEFRVGYGGNWNGNNGGGGGGYYPPQNQGYRVKCQSFNYQPARCPASIRVGVRITNIIGGECKMNRSWGWDRGGIWVNNGCRAEFMVDG